jgi:hypothetical protein
VKFDAVTKSAWLNGARGLILATALGSATTIAAIEPLKPAAYYFPRQEACTVMMDFAKARDKVRGLAGDARNLELTRGMLAEWSVNAADKCKGAGKVALLAVYIPGLDVYGRPDFSNRTNLLKLEGQADKLQALARASGLTMELVRKSSAVEIF